MKYTNYLDENFLLAFYCVCVCVCVWGGGGGCPSKTFCSLQNFSKNDRNNSLLLLDNDLWSLSQNFSQYKARLWISKVIIKLIQNSNSLQNFSKNDRNNSLLLLDNDLWSLSQNFSQYKARLWISKVIIKLIQNSLFFHRNSTMTVK